MDLTRLNLARTVNVCERAIEEFGKQNQINKCKEELIELLFELKNSADPSRRPDKYKVLDECADVLITTLQMALLHGGDMFITKVINRINRLDAILIQKRVSLSQ